jgi:hypothetical protein
MKIASHFSFALLALLINTTPLAAQQQVAEGEYQVKSSKARPRSDHWVLTTKPSGGYLLRSEIQSPAEEMRVIQSEELSDQLVPTSIGYELYLKKHTEPDVSMNCGFAANAITCDGKSEKGRAKRSKPFKYEGPFLLAVRDLSCFDFSWLLAGALNMAHLTSGKTPLRTIRVTGGAALELTDDINIASLQAVMTPNQKFTAIRPEHYTAWEFISGDEDEEMLVSIGVEDVQLSGTKVAARHYSLTTGDVTMHFWLADPGILVKMSSGKGAEYFLSNYRQYKKLISEFKVDDPHNN